MHRRSTRQRTRMCHPCRSHDHGTQASRGRSGANSRCPCTRSNTRSGSPRTRRVLAHCSFEGRTRRSNRRRRSPGRSSTSHCSSGRVARSRWHRCAGCNRARSSRRCTGTARWRIFRGRSSHSSRRWLRSRPPCSRGHTSTCRKRTGHAMCTARKKDKRIKPLSALNASRVLSHAARALSGPGMIMITHIIRARKGG